jgi:phospholipid/cholesterol/gamma-HCH transport system substrate-binding protein
MNITRQVWIQLSIFIVVSVTAVSVMAVGYMRLPLLLFGAGRYTVTLQLPNAGNLYPRANVTYRGTTVGQVKSVHLTETGVEAVLSLESDFKIPSDLNAEVHSQSAIGEQYVALLPRSDTSAPLSNGAVIPRVRASIPPDINSLLDATNRGLTAIPQGNLKTVIDESYTAVGGLGPELDRLVKGSTSLAIDARANLNDLTNVIDNVGPVLDSQTDSGSAIQRWAANLATITGQLRAKDSAVAGVIQRAGGATDEARQLIDRLQPTLPIVLANLVSVDQVAVTYRQSLEQLLVLLPQGAGFMQAFDVPNRNTKQAYKGGFLSFNLNLNLPPPCTTGFLPASQRRSTSLIDYPDRPAEDLYCRVPQDSVFKARGARNFPCVTRPGKRAPTAKMCESDENYVPLNDGYNWKGDPNATLSGQPIPQPAPDAPPGQSGRAPDAPPAQSGVVLPPIGAADYDPATGTYVGPDGHVYTQGNLAQSSRKEQTWQAMLLPPP